MAIDKRLAEFADKAELRELIDRYARAIDRRDMDLLRACYHPDAIDNHGVLFSGGIEDYIAWQPSVMSSFENSAHYIVNALFEVNGDYAEGEAYFFGFHRILNPEPRHDYVGGRYLDKYRRGMDRRWRFAQRDLVWDWRESRMVSDQELSFVRSLGHQGCGAADPSFALRPLLAKAGKD